MNCISIMNKYITPLLLTILWGLALYLCIFELWDSTVTSNLINGKAFIGISSVYIVFLFESVIYFFDSAITHLKRQFNVNLVFLLCSIILLITITLFLSYLFIFNNSDCSNLLWGIFFCMITQKMLNSFYCNNIELFLIEWSKKPLTSNMP